MDNLVVAELFRVGKIAGTITFQYSPASQVPGIQVSAVRGDNRFGFVLRETERDSKLAELLRLLHDQLGG